MKYYAGIGSRETPPEIMQIMTDAARILSDLGYCLRSGGAPGADSAFEAGATHKQIFLPWKNFNNNPSPLFTPALKAYRIAELHHPAWLKCGFAAKKLHARNSHQILGPSSDLDDPVEFVLCWTEKGLGKGGTGQALRIAKQCGIPIHDFGTGNLNWTWVLINGNVDSNCKTQTLGTTV